jgi:RNA polymerase sigma-70 factor (ECF subfamily)
LDRSTFDRLVLEHLSSALRLAIRLCGDPTRGEDVAHDAVVRAAGAYQTLRDAERFKPWFFQIVVNVFRDGHRRDRVQSGSSEAADLPDPSATSPASALSARETSELVAACVSALPPRQREVIVLVVYEGMTGAEASEVLGISDGNVRTTLHLARENLRRQLGPLLDEAGRV